MVSGGINRSTMVFEGGMVAPLGLLQELHSHLTLSHILIHTPEEVKMGQKNRVSCCPICMYVIKKRLHVPHHQPLLEQFFLWEMPGVCSILWTADEETLSKVWWPQGGTQESALQGWQITRAMGSHKSGHKPKKGRKDKADKDDKHGTEDDKLHRSPSRSSGKTASQEKVPGTLHHSQHLAGSTSGGGHHKKLKKHGKKKSHRKSH